MTGTPSRGSGPPCLPAVSLASSSETCRRVPPPPDAPRCSQMCRDVPRFAQIRPDAARCAQMQRDAARCSQMQRDAARDVSRTHPRPYYGPNPNPNPNPDPNPNPNPNPNPDPNPTPNPNPKPLPWQRECTVEAGSFLVGYLLGL
eukprot:scaffold115437_cov57-Phaeocystis_antarctica.AAC.6